MTPRALLLFLLSFLFFTSALAYYDNYDPIYATMSLFSDNPSSRVFLYNQGRLSLPDGIRGNMTLSIKTSLDVELCLQEWVEVTGNLSTNCNSGGYFNVSANSTSSVAKFVDVLDSLEAESALGFREDFYEVTKKLSFDYFGNLASSQNYVTKNYSTTLRTSTIYYLTARYITASSNTTSIDVKLYYDNTDLCDYDEVGLTNGKCAAVDSFPDSGPITHTFVPDQPRFFSYEVDSGDDSEKQTFVESVTTKFSVSSSSLYSNNAYLLGALPNVPISVYVRRDAAPDLVNNLWDAYQNVSINGTADFVLTTPMDGTWYYQVANTGSYDAEITVQMWAKYCADGYAGPFCNATVIDLTNQPVNNATWVNGTGGLQYFIVRHTDLIIGTGTEKLVGNAPAIFASFFNTPSNDSYIVSASGNPVNLITASVPYQTIQNLKMWDITWNIAVWSIAGQQYYIWANHACAQNCTAANVSHGTCNQNTGYCTCNSGYSGLWCEKSGLALIWIILIVIACAIVLAIATGVPIACYLKGKKRKQYERV